MNINAAILWKQGAPLSVEEAELEAPRAGEVLVELKAAGVATAICIRRAAIGRRAPRSCSGTKAQA